MHFHSFWWQLRSKAIGHVFFLFSSSIFCQFHSKVLRTLISFSSRKRPLPSSWGFCCWITFSHTASFQFVSSAHWSLSRACCFPTVTTDTPHEFISMIYPWFQQSKINSWLKFKAGWFFSYTLSLTFAPRHTGVLRYYIRHLISLFIPSERWSTTYYTFHCW